MHQPALSAVGCTQPRRRNRGETEPVQREVIEDLLRRHDGVITSTQAKRAGLSQDAIERRVRSGAWRRCSRGVFFADDRPFTDAARIRAEVWGRGPRAAACGLTAAWWHGVTAEAPDHVNVTVPLAKGSRSTFASTVRRRDLASADLVIRRNLLLTAIPLTVLEAVSECHSRTILDSALQRGVTLGQLKSAHVRNARRHGATIAGRLLKEGVERCAFRG